MTLPFPLLSRTHPSQGFSLVEMLLVVGLISILVAGGVANYRRLNERKIVDGAVKQVEQSLRDAQKQASAGVKPNTPQCTDPQTLTSYRIQMSGTTYSIQANCSGGSSAVSAYSLPAGTQFTFARNLTFYVLSQGANNSSTVCVQNTSGSIVYAIFVDRGGAVSYMGSSACGVLNSATGMSCNALCSSLGMSCNDVGIDLLASNNQRRRNQSGACQIQTGAGCGTPMGATGLMCSGIASDWTYCQCQ